MRKQPLLALISTAATLTAAGTASYAARIPIHSRRTRASHHARPAQSLAMPAILAADLHRPSLVGTTAAQGPFVISPLTFAVTGQAVLGTWASPSQRRARALARARAARLAHERRRLVARPRPKPRPRTAAPAPAGGVWLALRECESGDNYQADTGNGYYGAYQFALGTWWSIGFTGMPNQAPPAVQDRAAALLQSLQGWSPWPVCSAVLGLR